MDTSSGAPGRDEAPAERADRNWNDLMQELRVTETGVQVLFSLLLTVPFSARFDSVTPFQRRVYFVTLLVTAASNVALIAPVAYHRTLFQRGDKPLLVRQANRFALVGLALLVTAVTGVLLLVTDVLFATPGAALVASLFGVATLTVWFGPPGVRRWRDSRS